nr:unnamed protein product [Spirometra erinaceieuropaei]
MGLADSDGIPDRVAYGEFLKLYYFDCLMFGFLSLPHMSGFFFYNFTPAFDFGPHTFAFKLTFYLLELYPVIYPVFSMHLLRIFRNPLSYTKEEVKAKISTKTELSETKSETQPAIELATQPVTQPEDETAAAGEADKEEKKKKKKKKKKEDGA